MSRILRIFFPIAGVLVALASGYYLGLYRSEQAFDSHFRLAVFQRETMEAHQERRLLEALREKRVDLVLEVTQYSYYSRLLLASETAQQSSNPELRQHMLTLLQPDLVQAQKMMQKHPFRFPTEEDQNRWTTLIQSSK